MNTARDDNSIDICFCVFLPLALALFCIGLAAGREEKPSMTDAQRLEQCQKELGATQRLLQMHVEAQR